MSPDVLITLSFGVYLLMMLFLGWMGYLATHNLSDYILGGRRLGSIVTALSAGASDMSAWLLMSLPGTIYSAGLSGAWIAVGLTLGAWSNWKFVAARLRVYTEKCGNALTLPDYFTNRFEDKSRALRILSTLTILIFFTIYCASGVVAGARLFEDIFHMPYQTALWVGAIATIFYVFIGGFLAVSWTDTVQASLMITALIMVPLVVIYHEGGVQHSLSILQHINPHHTQLLFTHTPIEIISLLAWGLGYFGQPHILVRFMAAESANAIPKARRIGMTWMVLCLAGAVAVGFFAPAYFFYHPAQAHGVTSNTEMVFIELTQYLFHPLIGGFLLAAILAAIMSTLSCQLLLCSSALTEDIYRAFLRKKASQRELIWIGRLMVLFISSIALWIAWNPEARVLHMVSYAWAGFGASFGSVILLSLTWSRMTREGAMAGMLIGAITVIVWKHFAWFGLYEIIPGFIFSILAIVIVSRFSAPPSRRVLETFESVRKLVSVGKK